MLTKRIVQIVVTLNERLAKVWLLYSEPFFMVNMRIQLYYSFLLPFYMGMIHIRRCQSIKCNLGIFSHTETVLRSWQWREMQKLLPLKVSSIFLQWYWQHFHWAIWKLLWVTFYKLLIFRVETVSFMDICLKQIIMFFWRVELFHCKTSSFIPTFPASY